MPIYITLTNFKGGVGKSTSVQNIGAALAFMGKRVLLIDLDPQHNLTQCFGIEDPDNTVYQAIGGKNKPSQLQPIEVGQNLWLCANDFEMIGFDMDMASVRIGREYRLRDSLKGVAKDFDYILCDCPPALSFTTVNALLINDDVKIIVPIEAEFLALKGYGILQQEIGELEKDIDCIFITKYDQRKSIMKAILNSLKEQQADKLLETYIRTNVAITEAQANGQTIFDYKRYCPAARDYHRLAKEIIQRYEYQ